MKNTAATHNHWKQYRAARIFIWVLLTSFIASVIFLSDASVIIAGAIWAVFSFAMAFWPCPLCGGRVGYIALGPFMAVWPFGGWCTSCRQRLFLRGQRA